MRLTIPQGIIIIVIVLVGDAIDCIKKIVKRGRA